MKDSKLLFQAIVKFLLGTLLVGLLVFVPAGTLSFKRGWLFMDLLFVPMFIVGVVMYVKNPSLLASRLDAKEKQGEQKEVVALSGLMFIVGFVLAGLNERFGWIHLPDGIIIIASVVFLLSYLI